jgi:hypothetical protein
MALMASMASGYYFFVHFTSRFGPYLQIPEKYDLTTLPNKTVTYQISDLGPDQLAQGDSFASMVSQIRAAAKVWNDVDSSDLRLAFGGLESAATAQNSPGIDVIFDDLPPGVLAQSGITKTSDLVTGPNGQFFPAARSLMRLRKDYSTQPSYTESFFLTVAHEFGHTLGLQHELTGSLMSTQTTRGVTKSKPLTADDIAGISILYPTKTFLQTTGSISGTVQLNGTGVNLASVVAISASGPAVSTLTNPDGSYRIDAIPPGQYYIYAHPLPPAAFGQNGPDDIVTQDLIGAGQRFVAGGSFTTVFYPGTQQPQQTVNIQAGNVAGNINFNVQGRTAPALYAMSTYSFPGPLAVKSSYISRTAAAPFIVATAVGLINNNNPAAGLGVNILGGAAAVAPAGIKPYSQLPSDYAQFDLQLGTGIQDGPQHMWFTLNNDVYVLPNAFHLVSKLPPAISSVTTQADRSLLISGTNFSALGRVYFDGQPAAALSADETSGRIVVNAPPAAGGQKASVALFNPDGTSSLFMQAPPVYTYDATDAPAFTLTPAALPAGVEAMVQIDGRNVNFLDGLTGIGFGTSDVQVRRIWVLSPTRAVANVIVSSSAAIAATDATLVNGLQLMTQSGGFQLQAANPRQLFLPAPASSSLPGNQVALTLGVVPSSGPITVTVANLLSQAAPVTVPVISSNGNQIVIQLPSNLAPGPVVVRVQAGTDTALPIVLTVDPLPTNVLAQIGGVVAAPGFQIDPITRPARAGDTLIVLVTGLPDGLTPSKVTVNVGGIEHQTTQVSPFGNAMQLQFVVLSSVTSTNGITPMYVTFDGNRTSAYNLPLR